MNLFKLLLFILSLNSFTFALEIQLIESSEDSNFNGIQRGITVFQDILRDDYGAVNQRGLIELSELGEDLEANDIVGKLFQNVLKPGYEGEVFAHWERARKPRLLDRGYFNDGSENPRVPERLQKVIDLYNSQIMGAVSSMSSYELILFSINSLDMNSSKKGWIVFNRRLNQALYTASNSN